MTDDEAEAVGNDGARDGVAILLGDRGYGERAQVEEDYDFGGGGELGQELDEDCRCHVADFVEEDGEAFNFGDFAAAEGGC